MDTATFYALFCSLCFLQIFESVKLLKQRGEQLVIDRAFSFIEFAWVWVAAYALAFGGLSSFGVALCVSYVAYNAFGWFMAAKWYAQSVREDNDTVFVPIWYFRCCAAWATLGAAIAGSALWQVVGHA